MSIPRLMLNSARDSCLIDELGVSALILAVVLIQDFQEVCVKLDPTLQISAVRKCVLPDTIEADVKIVIRLKHAVPVSLMTSSVLLNF